MRPFLLSNLKKRSVLLAILPSVLASCGGGSSGINSADVTPQVVTKTDVTPQVITKATTITAPASIATPSTTYNYYVSTTGSDSNPGTQSAPFLTIQAASRVAKPDTTIHVAAGTYAGGFQTAANGTATTRIYYVSDTKWGAKIVGAGAGYIWLNTGNFVTVAGFDLTGSGKAFGLISGPWSGGDVGHHFTATNNYIHDIAVNFCGSGGAIDVFSVTGQSIITNNIIKNVNAAQIGHCATMQGIYISDTGSYVANNLVSGVAAVGIQQWHAATNSIIVNNTVFNSKEGILIGSGDSGALPGGSSNNYVANNISYNNATYGVVESGAGTNNRYVNNLVVGNPTNWSVAGTVSGTISAAPMFVNYQANGTGDYHLQSGSPAIGTGSPTDAPIYDLDGTLRGTVMEIGAY